MEKLSVIFIIGFLLTFLPQTGSGEDKPENLLVNPSFEEGEPGKEDWEIVDGWRILNEAKTVKPCVKLDTELTLTGNRSLRIESKGFKNKEGKAVHPLIASSPIPVKIGHTYKYSVWIKGERPGLKVGLVIDGWRQDAPHWFKCDSFVVSDEWKEYSIIARIPDENDIGYFAQRNSVYVRVDLNEENGVIWIDNVRFKEKEK